MEREAGVAETVTVAELARHLTGYIDRVANGGESFILVRGKTQVAELRPPPAPRPAATLKDVLDSLPRLTPEEAAAFADDLEAVQREANRDMPADPSES